MQGAGPSTDTERAAAMRWLARNVAWSRRISTLRAPPTHERVLVAFAAIDRNESVRSRSDRVA
jgi:hypothetical protein